MRCESRLLSLVVREADYLIPPILIERPEVPTEGTTALNKVSTSMTREADNAWICKILLLITPKTEVLQILYPASSPAKPRPGEYRP